MSVFDVAAEVSAANRMIRNTVEKMAQNSINRITEMHTVGTGVCHCGAEMRDHPAWDNHGAVEMRRDKAFDKNGAES